MLGLAVSNAAATEHWHARGWHQGLLGLHVEGQLSACASVVEAARMCIGFSRGCCAALHALELFWVARNMSST